MLVSVEGLTRTLEKIYAARGLAIEVDVSSAHFVHGQREDLEEMLGNLLDNACKWAKSNVKIQSVQENGAVVELGRWWRSFPKGAVPECKGGQWFASEGEDPNGRATRQTSAEGAFLMSARVDAKRRMALRFGRADWLVPPT